MIAIIKSLHTLIFFVLSASILHILYAGITNRITRLTALALSSIVLESAALVLNGWKCPLTSLAERLGTESGSVTDIFLPRWMADRIFTVCTPLYLIGCILVVARRPWRK